MRRKRLLPDPDGPVMAAHAPLPRFSSNGPANALRSSLTRSAVSIESPLSSMALPASQKFPTPAIKTIAILQRLLRIVPALEVAALGGVPATLRDNRHQEFRPRPRRCAQTIGVAGAVRARSLHSGRRVSAAPGRREHRQWRGGRALRFAAARAHRG